MYFRKTVQQHVYDLLLIAVLMVIVVLVVYPFWNQLVVSLNTSTTSGIDLFPKKITVASYQLAFHYDILWTGYENTIIRAVLGVLLSVTATVLTAYPLSKVELPFNRLLTMMIVFTMLFSGGMIPSFLLVKQLGMLDTMSALVLPHLVSAFNVFIMRNFFRSIPESLEESARVDGAGYLQILLQIVIPLSKPVLATIALWVAVYYWNEWFEALIYVSDPHLEVLQVVLRKIIIENNMDSVQALLNNVNLSMQFSAKQLQATMIMLSVLPMLLVYPFIQKYFVKGIMVGSVKG